MSSSSSKVKVFVFGGNGHLGSAIISALTSHSLKYHSHFHVTAVIRPETLHSKDEKKSAAVSKLRAAGVTLVEGDSEKASVEDIAKWIHGQDIVVSTISYHGPDASPDLKFVEAVKHAKVPWFIPSFYGVDFTGDQKAFESIPGIGKKLPILDAIRNGGINSFFVMNGFFLEYLISPFAGIDIANATVTAPYSFDAKVSTTKVEDIAHFTAELLLRREESSVKNQVIHLSGDTISYNQIHALLEEHFKKTFKKVIVSREEAIQIWKEDVKFENIPGRFRVIFGEQQGVYWDESWNGKHAHNIKPTTVKQYIAHLK
jgi:uncharacterized protein YbjT (DUF2867 family)